MLGLSDDSSGTIGHRAKVEISWLPALSSSTNIMIFEISNNFITGGSIEAEFLVIGIS